MEYMKWAGSIKESQSFSKYMEYELISDYTWLSVSLANSASQLLRRSRSNPSDQLLAKKVCIRTCTHKSCY